MFLAPAPVSPQPCTQCHHQFLEAISASLGVSEARYLVTFRVPTFCTSCGPSCPFSPSTRKCWLYLTPEEFERLNTVLASQQVRPQRLLLQSHGMATLTASVALFHRATPRDIGMRCYAAFALSQAISPGAPQHCWLAGMLSRGSSSSASLRFLAPGCPDPLPAWRTTSSLGRTCSQRCVIFAGGFARQLSSLFRGMNARMCGPARSISNGPLTPPSARSAVSASMTSDALRVQALACARMVRAASEASRVPVPTISMLRAADLVPSPRHTRSVLRVRRASCTPTPRLRGTETDSYGEGRSLRADMTRLRSISCEPSREAVCCARRGTDARISCSRSVTRVPLHTLFSRLERFAAMRTGTGTIPAADGGLCGPACAPVCAVSSATTPPATSGRSAATLVGSERPLFDLCNGVVTLRNSDFPPSGLPEGQVGAVAICPLSGPVVCFEDNLHNLQAAVTERITKNKTKVTLNADDRRRITSVMDALLDRVFTPDSILAWAVEHGSGSFSELRSSAWSEQRFSNALERLLEADVLKRLQPDASVKHEVLPLATPPKAPRMLLADGDEGQLLSLPVIACLEHLMFHAFPARNIKHRPSEEGVLSVLRHLNEACGEHDMWVAEGDGSAWDVTCSSTIRQLVENRVIRHIGQVLGKAEVVPLWWRQTTEELNQRLNLRLRAQRKEAKRGVEWDVHISAIRRSGHRGTSSLNWLTNFALWSAALLADPAIAVHQPGVVFLPTGGRLCFGFEGDDSILAGSGWRDAAGALRHAAGFWKRAGFNMKLKIHGAGSVAEFCGWHCLVGPRGPDLLNACPDIRRNVASGSWTNSKRAVASVLSGDLRDYHAVGAAACFSRYLTFVGRLPLLAGFYLSCGLWHVERSGPAIQWDRTHSMRHGPELPQTVAGVLALAHSLISGPQPRGPVRGLLEALGLSVSAVEEAALLATMGSLSTQAADHLPKSWLPDYTITLAAVPPPFLQASRAPGPGEPHPVPGKGRASLHFAVAGPGLPIT